MTDAITVRGDSLVFNVSQLLYAEIHWYLMCQTFFNRVELNQFEFLKPESHRPSLYIIMTASLPTIQSDKTEY